MHKVLVTGSAGFIGFHTVLRLLSEGFAVTGLDNINDYYDVNLKYGRLRESGIEKEKVAWGKAITSDKFKHYTFYRLNLEDTQAINNLFAEYKFDYVIHLAAQAGVRYSLVNPHAYVDSNIKGFLNILEACRHHPVKHLVYASSSSVYGANTKMPFAEHDNVDHPVSLYAATKKANELMAHTYSHLYNIPTTGLRFFTVYGPWGRPDMAIFLFTKAILEGKPLPVFNNGNMQRDFTYIDDIVEGVFRCMQKPATPNNDFDTSMPDPASSCAPYRIYNIGNSKPISLIEFIGALEIAIGKKAILNFLPMQTGDIISTWADIKNLKLVIGYRSESLFVKAISTYVGWYKKHYQRS
jgi:UDP-glucuronate 4-epimerase